MFNTIRLPAATLTRMHKSAERLYQAVKEVRAVEGQSAVARLLTESPQTVKNWESRGISADGAIKVERLIGCRAAWLIDGAGDMSFAEAPATQPADWRLPAVTPVTLAQAIEAIGHALAGDLPDDVRVDAADRLHKLAMRRGTKRDQQQVLQCLAETPTQAESWKRESNGR
jgi:hypothetical protein